MSTSIISFVIVLGVLIFFHELGHFLVARLFGVGVEKFSLGFGPRLFGKKIGLTDYRLSAIPLGGYVKMVGEEPDAELEPDQIPYSFTHKHVLKRILVVGAGPFFNILLAVLIFWVLFLVSGTYILKPSVGKVEAGSPAETGGLKGGDLITAIDANAVSSWDEMAALIADSKGRPLTLTVQRGESAIELRVTPRQKKGENLFGEEIERYIIGITAAGDVSPHKMGLWEAISGSILQTYHIGELTLLSIVKLIQGKISPKTLGGPIMIAQMSGQQAKQGVASLAFFIALISINLAILNFLPIPVLDGGHLLFFFIEIVIRRPVNLRVREIAQQAGMFILILLMVYVFYNDIARIIFS